MHTRLRASGWGAALKACRLYMSFTPDYTGAICFRGCLLPAAPAEALRAGTLPSQHPGLPPQPCPRRWSTPAVLEAQLKMCVCYRREHILVGRAGVSSCRLVPSRGRPGWSRQPTMSSVPDLHSAGAFRVLSSLCRLDLLLPIKRVSQEEPPSVCPRAHGASSLLWSQGPVPRSSLPSGNIQPWS